MPPSPRPAPVPRSYNTLPAPTPSPPSPAPPAVPFRQDVLWALCFLLFFAYLAGVLFLFLTSAPFRQLVVANANGLFALPYVLSIFVVAVCLAPCAPPPRRDLDGVIATPLDFCLVLLVLLEWATCLALVLITLIAVHDGLSYISPQGLIVPAPPDGPGLSQPLADDRAAGPPGSGLSEDSFVVLAVPVLLMYACCNFLLHSYAYVDAVMRRRRGLADTD